MIRKRLFATLCCAFTVLSLTGCGLGFLSGHGEDEAEQVTETPGTDKPDDDEAQGLNLPKPDTDKPESAPDAGGPDDDAPGGIRADHTYTYSETIRPYEEYGYDDEHADYSYETAYNLYANDDGTATLVVDYIYTEARKNTDTYNGKWEDIDGNIEFTYEAQNDNDYSTTYSFELSGDKVLSVNTFTLDTAVAQAAGTYTCDDPDMGMLELAINRDGSATLSTEDGKIYNGYISSEGTRYDFYAYEDDELVIDWYVDCSVNGSFSHAPYGEQSIIDYD
nr:hypothetical protein [Lachnospiraceae bacterium]